MQVAKSSPVVLKSIIVMGRPRRQLMMVKPLPSCVLGVILPYPMESNRHSITDYIRNLKVLCHCQQCSSAMPGRIRIS